MTVINLNQYTEVATYKGLRVEAPRGQAIGKMLNLVLSIRKGA